MHSGRRGSGMNRRQFLKGSLGAAGVAVAWANVKADQGIPELPEALPEDHRTATLESLREWQAQRFGMFVHWGPVSLRGTEIGWSRGREVPVDEYDALADDFNPEQFDADAWIRTAKEAGMKYFVITSKHHDGFCIWPSDYTDYDLTRTPYEGDILEELAEACERHGIDLGFYYSILDWRHPDYPYGSPGGDTEKPNPDMEAYVEFLHNQVRELIERYNPRIMW
ncbi:MAG: alpha-L-fucosidase, partial [Candidatus Hydrogenedentota bacterium]